MEKKYDKQELLVYALLWGIMFLAPVLSMYIRSTQDDNLTFQWDNVWFIWRQYALFFAIFLIHNFLLAPLLVYKQHRLQYFSLVGVLLAAFVIFQCSRQPDVEGGKPPHEMMDRHRPPMPMDEPDDAFFDDHRRPPFDEGMKPGREQMHPVFLGEFGIVRIVVLILMLGMNLGVKLYFKQRHDQKQLEQLERQNLEQQLEYLKYQINPHFLMNTLNNIHALVDIDPEQAKETIVELSKIMRFVLYEGSKQKVPLRQEIIFLDNYIQLMSMRVAEQVDITVDIPQVMPDREIPPLMLITFVENAFKHGVSYRQKSFIDIAIHINGERLLFLCRNSKVPQGEDHHGGVGLPNVKRRLELIYGSNYTLDIKDEADTYTVDLTLPLD